MSLFPWLLLWSWIVAGSASSADEDFHALCAERCPFQNKTDGNFDVGCGSDCRIDQCSRGCLLWRKALESSCQSVCNGTRGTLSQRELHCVMGCNDAMNQYFQKLKDEIGVPPAPYLVADTLTATSLSLAWEGARYSDISYLVQWRYEEHAGAWQYCRNQSWGPSSVVVVDNLQPYTKYRFRVALLLSPHSEPIVSEPSVVINTLAAGVPSSPPTIIRATAVDAKRISVSWKPGAFPNGPIHSYVLELVGEYTSLKEDIPASKTTDFYMFQNLNANSKYVVSVSMRNAVGEGPAATAEVSTPSEPSVKDALQPILILGSRLRVIKQGADMMLDVPVVIYESSSLITGIGIHVRRNLLFVSDAEGYVSVTSLKKLSPPRHVLAPSETNFKPLDLSVDWLNHHLYILGEVSHRKSTLWQVARCGLDGRGLTVAVAGITTRPLHIEVDPYNGYLFWLIQGHNRGGLYRLDLAHISNGIKREVVPDVILEDPNLGAFIVDHTNFCILVPNHAKNTVFSVSLDGRDVADVRANTQQALFQNVISLAIANGLFYWTNGEEVLAEDYHEEYHTYFHNHYLGSRNRSYISVLVDLPTTQPVPVPVNPPIHVQAVLGGHGAKVTWQTPHLVGGQGKGAWQNWSYELQVRNDRTGEVRTHADIANATFATVEDLDQDTVYVFKASAYTASGNGPWSSEFRGKTLKTPDDGRYPTILWSAAEGLLRSDVTGEEVETLVSQEKLKDYHFVDVAWFDDRLYLVTNTTKVYWYNVTSHEYRRFHHLDSVGSIAVDWIGKKLYWSNPKQQVILRGDLEGKSQENLLILTVAKELNIDAEHAFVYWSTGLSVECARLNGDGRRVYYPAEWFPGKHVKGLTLNMDDRHVYWIVRSNEGSTLYKAPMAEYSGATADIVPVKISNLQHPNMQGPLCYFNDHLLWLQDERNAVIGDLSGRNEAVIGGVGLSGLNVVAVIDASFRRKSGASVVPAGVDPSTIRVVGSSASFNITWEPSAGVDFGRVFYELKTEDYASQSYARTTESVLPYERAGQLHPYSELVVTVQAFTYWGASPAVKAVLHSPESPPSAPTKPRAFVTRRRNGTAEEAVGLLRWDFPQEPNGIVTGYRVACRYLSGDGAEGTSEIDLDAEQLELELKPLLRNATYHFQVTAFTSAGQGPYSEVVRVNTSVDAPVPTLLVATKDSIKVTDCDRKKYKVLLSGDQIVDITVDNHEGVAYWLNEMNEILRIGLDGTGKAKVHALNATGLGIAIDWIGRFLYWSQVDEDGGSLASSLYRMDLSQMESGFRSVERIARRSKRIQAVEVSPFANAVLWVEVNRHGTGHLMECRADGTGLRAVFPRECTCAENPSRMGRTFATDHTNPGTTIVVYEDEGFIYKAEVNGCKCRVKVHSPKLQPLSIATDHRNVYWSSVAEDVIYILDEEGEVEEEEEEDGEGEGGVREFAVRGVRKIRAVGSHLQPLPERRCLAPRQVTATTTTAALVDRTATSITLRLPKPQRDDDCDNVSLASVQYTVYFGLVGECAPDCGERITYSEIVTLDDLKPFSRYAFTVSLRNRYSEGRAAVGPPVVFATSAGAPSPPENVTVVIVDPTAVRVGWYTPRDLNDRAIWYEVHWRTEGAIAGVRQSGEQIVDETDTTDSPRTYKTVAIRKLLPDQVYLFWVRAYSRNSDEYSESEGVERRMLQEPRNITLLTATPYSLEIDWTPPPENLSLEHEVQYSRNGGGDWQPVQFRGGRYLAGNLSPKTWYRFRASITYARSASPYLWPQDRGFAFETLGDRPSRPGTPVIQHLRRDVYQVIWERSRDNGAEIDFYILEGSFRTVWRNKREANFSNDVEDDEDEDEEEEEEEEEEWIMYYNGTDNYWIMTELSPSMEYVFRVRAKNEYGWSDCSETSKSFDFTEAAMLADQQELGIVLVTTVTLVVLFCVVLLTTFCCLSKRRDKEKKDLKIMTLTRGRGPDVELATLRELPRRGNFIHNANILYAASADPPRDDEIALLPPVRRDQFKLTKFLGSGAFGEVYEGVAQSLPGAPDAETRVAIKALRKGATDHEKAEFLKEAQLMSHFKHEHILQLLGVCLDNDPNYILMELMEGGDLLSYLRLNRPLIATNNSIRLQDLLAICVDVAKGCRYLEEMHFVHRDLACRNCLVSSTDPRTRIVKIGDFGLARDIYKNDYYRKEGEGLLPVRWMAPESLIDGVFTTQSDVWAFGVLVWEIMTLGQQPYPARTNLEVLHYVRNGGRLGRPNNCSEDLYQLMLKSWSFNPELRPTFKYCLESLEELKSRTTNAPIAEADVGGNYPEGRGDDGVENDGYRHDDDDAGEPRKEGQDGDGDGDGEEEEEEGEGEGEVSPGEPHRYLELIYAEDGYEVPRVDGCPERRRTFSASSEGSASTLSYPAALVESDNATYFDSKDLSSLRKLLPNGNVPNGFKRDVDAGRAHS